MQTVGSFFLAVVGLRSVLPPAVGCRPSQRLDLSGLCHRALSFHCMAVCFSDTRKISTAVSSLISQLSPSHLSQLIRAGPPERIALLIKSKSTDKGLNYS